MKNKIFIFRKKAESSAEKESKTLLAEAVARFEEKTGEKYILLREDSGKPVFCGNKAFLSVTHTGEYFIAAFSYFPCGIDAEIIRDAPNAVKERYFTESEKEKDFFSVWCSKEAAVKLTGDGLSKIRSCEIAGNEAHLSGKTYFLKDAEAFCGVKTVIASEKKIDDTEWL